MLVGYFIPRISSNHKTLLTGFFNGAFEIMMKITLFIIKFSPLGIFGIVAQQVAAQSNLLELVSRLGLFMLVVVVGLSFHGIVTLSVFLRFVAGVNVRKMIAAMRLPIITAFTTASSNATLPLTMEAVENKAGVSNKISSFTLPLGATINMNGTALYELVAVIFIAQAYGVELSFYQQFMVVLVGLLTSIGAAGIPMASLVMISVILSMVGLPLEGLGLILAVDRILDMFRTTINVYSDACGAIIVAKTEGEQLLV